MPRPFDADRPPPRWRIPPAPLVPAGEMPGMAVLREAGPLAAPLWRCLRVVTDWAAAPPADRAALFLPQAASSLAEDARSVALPPPASEAVLAVAGAMERPEEADPERLAGACAALAGWAAVAYMPSAAAEFAAAAAAARPDSPGYARAAADEYRRAGRHAEAGAMYERAVALARLARDWECYVQAHAALGRVALLRGDVPGARRSLARALRRAARHGQGELRAAVLHDLFRLELRSGRGAEAEARGAEAAALYPPGHPALPELAGEAVAAWLEASRFEDAYPVLARLATRSAGPQRVRALGSLARAAAALGEDAAAQTALESLLATPPAAAGRAEALLEAGEGALLLGWADRAEAAARGALGSASRQEQPATAAAARSLLSRAGARRALGPVPPARRRGQERGALSAALAAALDGLPPRR